MAAAISNEFQLLFETTDVKLGSNVTLSCHLSPTISAVAMEIRWFRGTDCVCLYKNREVSEGRGYEGRVSLSTELERGRVSLTLKNFRDSDLGDYLCQVSNEDRTEEITIKVGTEPYSTDASGRTFHKTQMKKMERTWSEEERNKMKESALISELNEKSKHLEYTKRLLTERDKKIKDLEGLVEERDKLMQEKEMIVLESKQTLQMKDMEMKKKDKLLKETNDKLLQTNRETEEKQRQLDKKNTELKNMSKLMREKERLLENMDMESEEKRKLLKETNDKLLQTSKDVEDKQNQLTEKNIELDNMSKLMETLRKEIREMKILLEEQKTKVAHQEKILQEKELQQQKDAQEIKALQSEIQRLRKEACAQSSDREVSMSKLTSEKERLLENTVKEMETSKHQLETLRNELQDKSSQLQEMKILLEEQKTKLTHQEKILQEKELQQQETAVGETSASTAPVRRRNSMESLPPLISEETSSPKSVVLVPGSELRLVLLGRTGSGRRAAGNIILGREERSQTGTSTETQQSESRQGEVAGRQVTVVDTPDWFCSGLSLEEVRQDVGLCVRLSAPGPHAFLLVIPVKQSTGEERGMLEKMEQIFGERCWTNTMILFTVTNEEQEKNIEEFVQSGNREVQRLVEKCGNRFHCLNVNQSGDGSQVSELLEKIEKMEAENTDKFYSSEIYLEFQEMIKRILEEMKNSKQREVKEIQEKMEREVQDALSRFTVTINGLKDRITQYEVRITELERIIKNEKEHIIRELERERDKEILQRQMAEEELAVCRRKAEREKSAIKERYRQMMKKITEMYDAKIRMISESMHEIYGIIWILMKTFNMKIEEKDREIETLKRKLSVTQRGEKEASEEKLKAKQACQATMIKETELIKSSDIGKTSDVTPLRRTESINEPLNMSAKTHCIDSSVLVHGSELRLVLLGRTGSGRRAAGNIILGREERSQTGTSTETQQSESRQGEVAGRQVTMVDTPDWFCSGLSLEEVRQDVGLCVRLSAPGPHAFLLVIPVKQSTGEERGMLEKMEQIFGERCWRNTMILFTVTDEEQEKNIEEFVQSGNQELQRLVEKCGNKFHCLNINQSGDASQVSELLEKIKKMEAENTKRFYSSEIYLETETQIREMERKIMREREEKNQINRQVEEKESEIETLKQRLLKLPGERREGDTAENERGEGEEGQGWMEDEEQENIAGRINWFRRVFCCANEQSFGIVQQQH